MVRYTYSYLCSADVAAELGRGAPISFRQKNLPRLYSWRQAFALHRQACKHGSCAGPLFAAGVEICDAQGCRQRDLYQPFEDWESGTGVLRPANLNPANLGPAVARLERQVLFRGDPAWRGKEFQRLRLQLAQWGVRVRKLASLGDLSAAWAARPCPATWKELPGSRPTRWNSDLLRPHVPPGILSNNHACLRASQLCQLPEPAGGVARAANLRMLAALAVRDALFGHPNLPSPAQLCARLMSVGVVPLAVVPGIPAMVLCFEVSG